MKAGREASRSSSPSRVVVSILCTVFFSLPASRNTPVLVIGAYTCDTQREEEEHKPIVEHQPSIPYILSFDFLNNWRLFTFCSLVAIIFRLLRMREYHMYVHMQRSSKVHAL